MFDVNEDKIGIVSANLALWSYPFAAVAAICGGYVFDILGRRLTFIIGFSTAAICLFFVPYTSPHVFP